MVVVAAIALIVPGGMSGAGSEAGAGAWAGDGAEVEVEDGAVYMSGE